MEKKKILGILGIVIGTIVVVAGSTYAYYTATATNSGIAANMAANEVTSGLSLAVTLNSTSATGYLVPQLTTYLGSAVGATTQCVDSAGNTVCKVYKVAITNSTSGTIKVNGTITFSGGTFTNLKWEELASATTVKSTRTTNASTTSTWLSNVSIAKGTSYYYIAVWIAETGAAQSDTGTFRGTITLNSSVVSSFG